MVMETLTVGGDDMTDWPQIIATYGGIAWKTARRLLNNDADAADCFQETFVAAFELSRTQTIQNWPGLVTRLATRRALDRLRKRKSDGLVSIGLDEALEQAGRSMPPPAVAEENELFHQLREGLAELPADQAEACCLRFLESLSYEQIADELDVTVNHVGVLLHRAKLSLKNRLAAFAPVSDESEVNR